MMKKVIILFLVICAVGESRAQSIGRNRQAMAPTVMDFDSLTMSDPFILADAASHTYYLTGTGGSVWTSADLKKWKGPYKVTAIDTTSWMGSRPAIWAAEIHQYRDKYYYFATFTNARVMIDSIPLRYNIPRRASHILVSDKPDGPYKPVGKENYLPANQATLDGTFWIEDGKPYMIYCHEWLQAIDGMMDATELKPDLSGPVGKPFSLFRASDAPWVKEMNTIGEITYNKHIPGWVTDGPYLFQTKTGRLGMIWSSWGDKRYALGVAYSTTGKLKGPWKQEAQPLVSNNSGHGMIFKTFDGKLLMCLHYAVTAPGSTRSVRKPMLLAIDDSGDELKIIGPYRP